MSNLTPDFIKHQLDQQEKEIVELQHLCMMIRNKYEALKTVCEKLIISESKEESEKLTKDLKTEIDGILNPTHSDRYL